MKLRRSEKASERFEQQLVNIPPNLQDVFRRNWSRFQGTKRRAPWEAFLEWAATSDAVDDIQAMRAKKLPKDSAFLAAFLRENEQPATIRDARKAAATERASQASELARVLPSKGEQLAALGEVKAARKGARQRAASLGARCDALLDEGLLPRVARALCGVFGERDRVASAVELANAEAGLFGLRAERAKKKSEVLEAHREPRMLVLGILESLFRAAPRSGKTPADLPF